MQSSSWQKLILHNRVGSRIWIMSIALPSLYIFLPFFHFLLPPELDLSMTCQLIHSKVVKLVKSVPTLPRFSLSGLWTVSHWLPPPGSGLEPWPDATADIGGWTCLQEPTVASAAGMLLGISLHPLHKKPPETCFQVSVPGSVILLNLWFVLVLLTCWILKMTLFPFLFWLLWSLGANLLAYGLHSSQIMTLGVSIFISKIFIQITSIFKSTFLLYYCKPPQSLVEMRQRIKISKIKIKKCLNLSPSSNETPFILLLPVSPKFEF